MYICAAESLPSRTKPFELSCDRGRLGHVIKAVTPALCALAVLSAPPVPTLLSTYSVRALLTALAATPSPAPSCPKSASPPDIFSCNSFYLAPIFPPFIAGTGRNGPHKRAAPRRGRARLLARCVERAETPRGAGCAAVLDLRG